MRALCRPYGTQINYLTNPGLHSPPQFAQRRRELETPASLRPGLRAGPPLRGSIFVRFTSRLRMPKFVICYGCPSKAKPPPSCGSGLARRPGFKSPAEPRIWNQPDLIADERPAHPQLYFCNATLVRASNSPWFRDRNPSASRTCAILALVRSYRARAISAC